MRFLFFITLLLPSVVLSAPYDKTGLIDLKNQASVRGSCAGVAGQASFAAGVVSRGMLDGLYSKSADEQWRLRNEANEIERLGNKGNRLSEAWLDRNAFPPSQMSDLMPAYLSAGNKAQNLIASKKASIVMLAFLDCVREL